jgi:predicted dehydrogenase
MVTSLAEARSILEAVRRTGRKLLVGQTCRFIEQHRTAKWLADQGRYGRVLYIEATYNHDLRDTFPNTAWRYQMPQNFLYGGLCHPMDLAFWIGGPITEVSAFSHCSRLDPRYPPDVPDNYVVNLRFESGALGRVIGMYQFVHPEGMPYIELTIAGTEAGSCRGKVTWEPVKGERRVEALADLRPAEPISLSTGGHAGEVARYLLHFEDCLRHDREPEPGALEGTRVIAVLDAVAESARMGRSAVPEWEF